MQTKPLYTNQDKEQFGLFYKQCAADYMSQHNLGIEVDHVFAHNPNYYSYKVKPIDSLTENSSHYDKRSYSNPLEIKNKIICNEYPHQNINWYDYFNDFFAYLYSKANKLQRTIMQKEKFLAYSLHNISEALADSPQDLIEFIHESKEVYGSIISTSWLRSALVKTWYQTLEQNDFNTVMLDFFTFHKKEISKPKNYIAFYFIFDNFVTDPDTYKQLSQLLPPAQKNSSPFIDNDNLIYEVIIDKNILKQHIHLKENKNYVEMNNQMIGLFSLYGEDLNILNITLKSSEKGSSEFKMIVTTTANSTYNKQKFKNVLMGLYQGYADLSVDCQFSFQIPPLMTKQWFMNTIFSTIVPEKMDTNVVKKKKI